MTSCKPLQVQFAIFFPFRIFLFIDTQINRKEQALSKKIIRSNCYDNVTNNFVLFFCNECKKNVCFDVRWKLCWGMIVYNDTKLKFSTFEFFLSKCNRYYSPLRYYERTKWRRCNYNKLITLFESIYLLNFILTAIDKI